MISSTGRELQIVADVEELNRAAAREFVHRAEKAVQAKGFFAAALSGGSTPRGVYSLLGSEGGSFRARVPWDRVHLFWGDERHVPPDHPESNYRMVRETLLATAPVPPENVHRIEAERPDADGAAEDYERLLREFFQSREGRWPQFDLVLLGMGSDGHTASLFPHTIALDETEHLVVAHYVNALGAHRITLTAPVINRAANVIFLVSGESKASVLREVLEGEYEPQRLPSQLIRPSQGRLVFIVDRAAAGQLTGPRSDES